MTKVLRAVYSIMAELVARFHRKPVVFTAYHRHGVSLWDGKKWTTIDVD